MTKLGAVGVTSVGTDSASTLPKPGVGQTSINFWLDVLFWGAERFPFLVRIFQPVYLWFAWRFAGACRRATLSNARGILNREANDRSVSVLAKSVIKNFYESVYELGRCVRRTRAELAARVDSVEGEHHYAKARELGRGAIVLTAHLGIFELGMAALADRERAIHVVFQRDASARFERLRSRLRNLLGIHEAPVDEGWSVWMRLRDALLADEVVAVQGDRVMPGQAGVAVPFMGRQIRLPVGPLKLALATGAPIIPVFSIRTTPGHVRVVVEAPLTVERSDGPFNGRHPVVLAVAKAIERQVRANPDQWLFLEEVWYQENNRVK